MVERIQIVDEHNRPIGVGTRQEAWVNGSYHRLAHVVLRDEAGRFLLQKRSANKSLYPSLWTNAASGHVDAGETYQDAARRELAEELGVAVPLKTAGEFLLQLKSDGRTINQFISVFEGRVSCGTNFTLNTGEVSEIRWFTFSELEHKIEKHLHEFTPALVKTIRDIYG